MNIQEIPIEESTGLTLAYDLTGITPGAKKGAVFRRGHVIAAGDLEILRSIGKSHIKILQMAPDEVHEDEAALALGLMVAGQGIEVTLPGEAWADLVATRNGLLKVDSERLLRANQVPDVLVATRHNNSPVRAGDTVGKAKIRGLVIKEAVLDEVRRIAAGSTPTLEVKPYRVIRGGAVITGHEIYEGRKKDAFEPLLRQRLKDYGSTLVRSEVVPDDVPLISGAINRALDSGLDIVFVTGGGSPDDSTSEAVALSADEVVFHGVPVAPGAMTILAYAGGVPVLGVPGGLLARPRGFLDLVLPRLLVGERPTREEAAGYGHGGLCLRCAPCVFPACPFGK